MTKPAPVFAVALTISHAFHWPHVQTSHVEAAPLPYPPVLHIDGVETSRQVEFWFFASAKGPSYVLRVKPAQFRVIGHAPTLRLAA